VGSIRHWELLVLMLVAAATLVGYFVGALLVVYRLFEFISVELFVGVTIVAVLVGTWGTTKWETRRIRGEVPPLPPSDAPQLHQRVEEMAAELGMPKPDLHVIGDEDVNAFAHGTRWDGIIVVHSGLFGLLDDEDEMAAIIGHELAHLYYCDSLLVGGGREFERFIRKIARVVVLVVLTIATFGLFWVASSTEKVAGVIRATESVLVAPIMLSQNALSRYREFVADRTAATLLGDASPMITALTELETAVSDDADRLSPVNPVDRSRRLLHTHPSLDRRQTLLHDDFEREWDEFIPFYEGATLGLFTKFGLLGAPFFVIALLVWGVIKPLGVLPQYVTNPGPGLTAAAIGFFLLWLASLVAFPWAMLFAPGGRPIFGLAFLAGLAMAFFTGTIGRLVPVLAEIEVLAPVGYIAMTLVVSVYLGDATRTRIQRTEGGLAASSGQVGRAGLRTIWSGIRTAHLAIASSRLLQGCLLLAAIGLYAAESPFSWVLGLYLLLAVFTDGP